MSKEEIRVPDLGGSDEVEVIEISVKVGDNVAEEDSILVVESDKATVELPSPFAGKIRELKVAVGDKISEGDLVGYMDTDADAAPAEAETPSQPDESQSEEPQPEESEAPAKAPAKAAKKPSGGSRTETVKVPDIGGSEDVPIIEMQVKEGDTVEVDDPLMTLESDKASMEVPSPFAGKVGKLLVKVDDKVSEGDSLLEMILVEEGGEEGDDAEAEAEPESEESAAPAPKAADKPKKKSAGGSRQETVKVPDIGGSENVPVIEIQVKEGDTVEVDDPLVTLESDKASMEVPSPFAGKIGKLLVNVDDKVSEGDSLLEMTVVEEGEEGGEEGEEAEEPAQAEAPAKSADSRQPSQTKAKAEPAATEEPTPGSKVHAGPAVRKLARELGADLGRIKGSGPKQRITKDDVHAYVKQQLKQSQSGAAPVAGTGGGLPKVKLPDFSKFGKVNRKAMSRMQSLTADSMQRSWLNVPHVTQFEDADITDLETFRKAQKGAGEKQGIKITPLPFMLKACAYALKAQPAFNVALDMDKREVVQKHYVHIGLAVDTPNGLVVPVIRDVDQKGIWDLAREAQELAAKARDGKLSATDMQGACFTITSLGGIGGTAFTPIVNSPEVAILGVSKASMKPVWDGATFQPRLMLPLSLSYDHRAVNGAEAARFTTLLKRLLEDMRELMM